MKKFFLLLLSCYCMAATGQNLIGPVTISLPANLPVSTVDWATMMPPVLITAQTKLQNGRVSGTVAESRMLVTIRQGGSKVCGSYTPQTAPNSNFNAAIKTWSGASIQQLLAQECTLKPGSYELCVQFYGMSAAGNNVLGEACKAFTIADTKQESYSPPQNILPANDKKFTEAEAKQPIQFRWTPVVPKPKGNITYRLKVWQLMQGQNATQAMRTNPPIVTKEVDNITQAVVANIYTGPCRPPYLCDFVWQVEAVDKEGKGIGGNGGMSEVWSFKVLQNDIDTQIDSLKIGCCENGKQSISIKIKNNLANANTTVKKVWIMGVNGFTGGPYPLDISASLTPALPFNFLPAGGTKVFNGSINCIENMNTVIFKVETERIVTGLPVIDQDLSYDTLNCRCDACDEKHFTLNAPAPSQIGFGNNILSFTQPITVTTTPAKTIKSIKAELVYFEMVPENDFCIPCNKEAATYGHFTNGTNNLQWIDPQKILKVDITTPQLTPCCSALFKWCIRYKIEFTDCTSCSKIICYEKKKDGCTKLTGAIDNQNNTK